jgi:hypothetical protein
MKKPRAPRLVTTAITTTITIIFWIFFTLYQVFITKPAPSVEPELLEPINPTLNTDILDKIGNRDFFEEGSFTPLNLIQLPQEESTPVITPEEITPALTASEESQISQ